MSPYYTRSQQQLIDTTPVYNTRLQKRLRQLVNHNIDFDESTRLWNQNKVRNGQSYVYINEKKNMQK
tara:strand:- start:8 stop:208 length:201 start_codon:yes stop_codon:yes gene_type:complete